MAGVEIVDSIAACPKVMHVKGGTKQILGLDPIHIPVNIFQFQVSGLVLD